MTGTWVNVGGIVLGALLGILLKKGIPQRIGDAIIQVEGLVIGVIALNGILKAMMTVDPATGQLSDSGGLLLLISLVAGCLAGELLRLDDRLNHFGARIEKKLNAEGFAKGFITASLVFSVGAMSIIGPLNDGLSGDSSILLIKSVLDFTTAIVLASALGVGVLFSALPVLLLQGSVALLARWVEPFISDAMLAAICMVGYAIVLVIGVNFLCGTKIKTANLLPALLVPIVYNLLLGV